MTNKPVIIVTGSDLAPEAIALLGDYALVFAGKTPQTEALVALARQHNPVGIIVRYGSVSAEVMDAAPALKVISKHGTGTDTIDKAAAQARGITVTAAAGANAAAVAEHALALMLACAKSVVPLDARMHAGHWDKATHKSLELNGLTVGLVGLGAIGRRFARMCEAIGMRVIGFDPFATELPGYVEAVPLETIWEASDVISLQCPLTAENRNMVNAATLARCKRGVILVNTARGGLIDEAALLAAVRSGRVAAAGLDSFAQEPMATPHLFQRQPGFVLSPHIGGVTGAAYVNMGVAAATNTLAVLNQVREPAVGQR
ncbi:NAD(P)-dependent oxidoreductase [Cupriavidus taiwanensis]|uniref:NAD(P)-dependent oxidoreductase n=1 Tax=Cupriavidus taiwanensis TaxID=164546 RepID=UPI000E1027B1|nr:NAD(P)-dependent oxidoreductase [Cupriavidus taiwanensis]SOY61311.1 3-phosphoglycerate dehydrogenase [Cupriavidus taiwanensis]SOY73729.1 3-phosphoglycerate dehydrogenase [Cupriavidus taiwanensis]SOY97804.1 3-phosphoglycerate dehydrogenase [Cupriavidus taiwanensis]SOZ67632.1 3-phosphoglycerate dehydrogenase [Cupriavidus taiwanensis]SOZ84723.1 3-phosphoglycerate dehydrogenase [Cupriavidus taiwanensis]